MIEALPEFRINLIHITKRFPDLQTSQSFAQRSQRRVITRRAIAEHGPA
jgi:hypothetical protein